MWVLAVTGPESERGLRIRQALLDGYEATTGLWMDVHGALAAHLGFRVRWPFDLRHFTVSVGALVEGCALRQGAERGTPRSCVRRVPTANSRNGTCSGWGSRP